MTSNEPAIAEMIEGGIEERIAIAILESAQNAAGARNTGQEELAEAITAEAVSGIKWEYSNNPGTCELALNWLERHIGALV